MFEPNDHEHKCPVRGHGGHTLRAIDVRFQVGHRLDGSTPGKRAVKVQCDRSGRRWFLVGAHEPNKYNETRGR
jgi:hypothetical protein